ncbi:MAG: hypothetical protein ACPMAQ_06760, partial [Phycisphaerae bacterium]
ANDAAAWTAALRWTIREGRGAEPDARRRALARELLKGYTQEATSRAIEAVLVEMAGMMMRSRP